jgi:hypothetical protein
LQLPFSGITIFFGGRRLVVLIEAVIGGTEKRDANQYGTAVWLIKISGRKIFQLPCDY